MFRVQGHALCLDHYAALKKIEIDQAEQMSRERIQALLDLARATSNSALVYQAEAEIKLLTRPITNVAISDSVVGALNTGVARDIVVKARRMSRDVGDETSQAFSQLAAAVVATDALTVDQKNEAVSQLNLLADLAGTKPEERAPGIAKPIVTALGTLLSTTADLLAVWSAWGPHIRALFGLP